MKDILQKFPDSGCLVYSCTIKESEINMQNHSLCDECLHTASCSRYQSRSGPVLYCEEFESCYTYSSDQAVAAKDTAKDELKGLCRICLNRKYCNIKIPEGGIWHCDNFY